MKITDSIITILVIGLLSIILWWMPAAKASSSYMNPSHFSLSP